ncbi:nucleotide disphospho-sugar-binding domain-containing protein [Dietzia natronolimnaea]|uniref:nucleotide disphospho-sugar-binding domain-containing protein n=1 Tax=Dietzia natronolimnaea TaxID=161920 RepID=UPI0015FE3A6F|nr:nucleotide disphospho-sugar-binding domain-containing protein [Dietzia natronolimnaea]MBB1037662.1 glycosyltransferase [Dietzia natronolimnaea]
MTARGLIVVCATPMGGHVGPLTAVGEHLASQGWRVVMITGSRFAHQVTAAGLEHVALSGVADFDEKDPSTFTPHLDRYRGLRLSRYQVEQTFIQPITAQAATLAQVLAENEVSAVLTDGTFAGTLPLISRDPGSRPPVIGLGVMPLAQTSCDVAPTNSGLPHMAGPLGRLRNRLAHRMVRHVLFRATQRLARHRIEESGGRLEGFVLDFSAQCDRFLQLGPAEFEYARRDLAPTTAFAGPVTARRSRPVPQPTWWAEMLADPRPVIHVTQGTLDNHDLTQLVEPALEALADSPVQIVVTTGGAPADELVRIAPENARIAEYLDYEELLPRTSIMVTNGGFGGVMTALRHGVPLVVAPGGEDKPEVAARVGHFRVGINLRTRRPSPQDLRDAVDAVLSDTTFADSASAMRDAIATYDPFAVIDTELRHLIQQHPTDPPAHAIPTPDTDAPDTDSPHTEENPT